jgi:hypothetical protein
MPVNIVWYWVRVSENFREFPKVLSIYWISCERKKGFLNTLRIMLFF